MALPSTEIDSIPPAFGRAALPEKRQMDVSENIGRVIRDIITIMW